MAWGRSDVRGSDGEPSGDDLAGLSADDALASLRTEVDRLRRQHSELIDHANDIIYTHDLYGTFTSMNARGEQILGYGQDEIVTMNIADLLPPDQLEVARNSIAAKERDGGATTYELWVVAKDGERIPLEVSTRGIVRDGTMVGVQGIARDVRERKAAQAALHASERRYRALIELSGDVKMLLAADGVVKYVSPGVERALGYRPEERIGASIFDLMHDDDVAPARNMLTRLQQEGDVVQGELRVRDSSGEMRWLAFSARSALDEPHVEAIVVNYFDVTDRRRDEERLRSLAAFQDALISLVEASLDEGLTESFYGRVLRCAVEVIPGAQAGSLLLRDDEGLCQFAAVVGFDHEGLRDTYMHESELHRDAGTRGPQIVRGFDRGKIRDQERRSRIYRAGRVEAIAVTLSIPIELDGEPMAYFHLDNFDDADAFGDDAVKMARVFSNHIATLLQRFRLEADLRQERAALDTLAHSDELTRLPNRTMFYRRAREAVDPQGPDRPLAVFFFDLDAFKQVNDTYGHQFGDRLLEAVASRLVSAVRDDDTVSRWGGDEFVLLLPDIGSLDNAEALARRIIERINLPFSIADQVISIGCSIGVAFAENPMVSIDELTREADIALYAAKEAGRNRYRIYGNGNVPAVGADVEAP